MWCEELIWILWMSFIMLDFMVIAFVLAAFRACFVSKSPSRGSMCSLSMDRLTESKRSSHSAYDTSNPPTSGPKASPIIWIFYNVSRPLQNPFLSWSRIHFHLDNDTYWFRPNVDLHRRKDLGSGVRAPSDSLSHGENQNLNKNANQTYHEFHQGSSRCAKPLH